MAAPVIGRSPRRVPRKGATVDWSHPIAQGLEFCFVPAYGNTELARGYTATLTGTPAPVTNGFGAAASTIGANYFVFSGVLDAPFLGPQSHLWVGQTYIDSGTNFTIVSKCANTLTTRDPFTIEVNANGGTANQVVFRRANATTDRNYYYIGSFPPNRDNVMIWTVPALMETTTVNCWINGGSVDTSVRTGTATGLPTGTNAAIKLGALTSPETRVGNHQTSIYAIWRRQISQGEAQALYADPFCFLKV